MLYALQIGKPDPFLHQLIKIQKNQHKAANKFAEQLRDLKECISTLENLDSTDSEDKSGNCSIGQKQHATFKYMWQQKVIFNVGISLFV